MIRIVIGTRTLATAYGGRARLIAIRPNLLVFPRSLCFSPDARWLVVGEEFKMNHVGIAAHRAVLHVLLLGATG